MSDVRRTTALLEDNECDVVVGLSAGGFVRPAFARPAPLQAFGHCRRTSSRDPRPTILMIWSERTHRDPAHRWIRQLVREAALHATAPAGANA